MNLDFNYQDFDYITVDDTVKLDWNKVWGNRGHVLGEGMISPDFKNFYLNIPKNSSSSVKTVLLEAGWEYGNIRDYPNATPFAILRDPINRWISGITEYLLMYHQHTIDNIIEPNNFGSYPLLGDKLGLSLLFDRMSFDDHSERQAVFLQGLDLSKFTWFYINKDFNENLSKYLTSIGCSNDFSIAKNENSASDSPKKDSLKKLIKFIVESDEYKKYNLAQWHWCDYKLIEQVQFYGKR